MSKTAACAGNCTYTPDTTKCELDSKPVPPPTDAKGQKVEEKATPTNEPEAPLKPDPDPKTLELKQPEEKPTEPEPESILKRGPGTTEPPESKNALKELNEGGSDPKAASNVHILEPNEKLKIGNIQNNSDVKQLQPDEEPRKLDVAPA